MLLTTVYEVLALSMAKDLKALNFLNTPLDKLFTSLPIVTLTMFVYAVGKISRTDREQTVCDAPTCVMPEQPLKDVETMLVMDAGIVISLRFVHCLNA